jgi:hypothetical protein
VKNLQLAACAALGITGGVAHAGVVWDAAHMVSVDVNGNYSGAISYATAEPGTVGLMLAGLAFVSVKFSKRRT